MSSSQQPPPNFNNNGPPNENPQMHSSALLNDYYFEDAGALSNKYAIVHLIIIYSFIEITKDKDKILEKNHFCRYLLLMRY